MSFALRQYLHLAHDRLVHLVRCPRSFSSRWSSLAREASAFTWLQRWGVQRQKEARFFFWGKTLGSGLRWGTFVFQNWVEPCVPPCLPLGEVGHRRIRSWANIHCMVSPLPISFPDDPGSPTSDSSTPQPTSLHPTPPRLPTPTPAHSTPRYRTLRRRTSQSECAKRSNKERAQH